MASAMMPRQAAQRLLQLRRGISTQRSPLAAAAAAAAAASCPAAAATASPSPSAAASSSSRYRGRLAIAQTAAPLPLAAWRTCGAGGVRRGFSSSGSDGSGKGEGDAPSSRIWSFGEIKQLVENPDPNKNVVIIDVREPGELLETGRIPGAINIPITTAVQSFHISDQDFEDMYGFPRPPKDAHLLFYCRAGVRARSAAGLAQHAGWENLGEYPGSWLDWEAHQGPVEKV